jgi:hypothetical protein
MPTVEGFDESAAPWILSETVSCWFHEEEVSADYCENNAECFSFDEAVEHYFGEEFDCENWEDEYDMEDPEWYVELIEDAPEIECIFFFDTWENSSTMWTCDEEVDMESNETFDESNAPWVISESISCWFHDEETACYFENDGDCLSFEEAKEHYFGDAEEEPEEWIGVN